MAAVQLLQLGPGNLDQRSGEKNLRFGCISALIPLPVTNWASDEEKFIPNYSVEIIIFSYYDLNIHIMISTSML